MGPILTLIRKDYLLDFRQKYPILGIGLYVTSTIFITYLSLLNLITPIVWNGMFWIIVLLATVTGTAKSFIQEEDRSMYYHFLCSPQRLLLAKLIYQSGYQVLLVSIVALLFSLLLGNPVTSYLLFYLNLFIGSIGISISFTMISSISSKTQNQSMMMAVLGFPVVIPILLLSVSNSKSIILGATYEEIAGNTLTLISVIVIIIATSFVLFPYSRRN